MVIDMGLKTGRIILSVLMLALVSVGWASRLGGAGEERAKYEAHIAEAERLAGKGLYRKSLSEYESAFAINNSEEERKNYLDVYLLAVQDGDAGTGSCVDAIENACALYPDDAELQTRMLTFCAETGNYDRGYNFFRKLRADRKVGDDITALGDVFVYSTVSYGTRYESVISGANGRAVVSYGGWKNVVNANGDDVFGSEYDYISPPSASGEFFLSVGERHRVVDASGVAQAIVDRSIFGEEIQTRAVSDGMIPLFDGGWKYYDSDAESFILKEYEDVSSFYGGRALVKENGVWTLIDRDGNRIGSAAFDDVKLFESGEFMYGGKFIASENGSFGIYDSDGNRLAGLAGEDADVYHGGYIAFCENGKWGFADENGNRIIEPSYEAARSFSNGLAAVKTDGKWGFINRAGRMVILPAYEDAGYFTSGGICFIVDANGRYRTLERRFSGD